MTVHDVLTLSETNSPCNGDSRYKPFLSPRYITSITHVSRGWQWKELRDLFYFLLFTPFLDFSLRMCINDFVLWYLRLRFEMKQIGFRCSFLYIYFRSFWRVFLDHTRGISSAFHGNIVLL